MYITFDMYMTFGMYIPFVAHLDSGLPEGYSAQVLHVGCEVCMSKEEKLEVVMTPAAMAARAAVLWPSVPRAVSSAPDTADGSQRVLAGLAALRKAWNARLSDIFGTGTVNSRLTLLRRCPAFGVIYHDSAPRRRCNRWRVCPMCYGRLIEEVYSAIRWGIVRVVGSNYLSEVTLGALCRVKSGMAAGSFLTAEAFRAYERFATLGGSSDVQYSDDEVLRASGLQNLGGWHCVMLYPGFSGDTITVRRTRIFVLKGGGIKLSADMWREAGDELRVMSGPPTAAVLARMLRAVATYPAGLLRGPRPAMCSLWRFYEGEGSSLFLQRLTGIASNAPLRAISLLFGSADAVHEPAEPQISVEEKS